MAIIWPKGGRRQTKEQREEIIRTWFDVSPEAATLLAVDRGLSPTYAYKVVHERGLMEKTRHIPKAKRGAQGQRPNDPRWERAKAVGAIIV